MVFYAHIWVCGQAREIVLDVFPDLPTKKIHTLSHPSGRARPSQASPCVQLVMRHISKLARPLGGESYVLCMAHDRSAFCTNPKWSGTSLPASPYGQLFMTHQSKLARPLGCESYVLCLAHDTSIETPLLVRPLGGEAHILWTTHNIS